MEYRPHSMDEQERYRRGNIPRDNTELYLAILALQKIDDEGEDEDE